MSKKRDRSAYMKTYRAKNLERIQAYDIETGKPTVSTVG